ncbi:MAG: hypothetical protein ABIN97_17390 [Ginsengibacter sp.]
MKKNIFTSFFILVFLNVSAQQDSTTLKLNPKYKIWVSTRDGNHIKGILAGTSSSSITIFPGGFSEYNGNSKISLINESYTNVTAIQIHKKGGLLKGMLIGAGIGIAPILVGSIFGPSIGEGGAYVSFITFPLGTIIGAIIGSTSKKKFFIGGEASRFLHFAKNINSNKIHIQNNKSQVLSFLNKYFLQF